MSTKRQPETIRISEADSNIHFRWDRSIQPIAKVAEGDLVIFECRDGANDQFQKNSRNEDVMKISYEKVHALTGPVAIDSASPGDTLEVEIVDVKPRRDWGWTFIQPGQGILASDPSLVSLEDSLFEHPYLALWTFAENRARFGDIASVPIRPFMGVMGVAPRLKGIYKTIPPFEIGGNLDIRQLVKGSRIFFPVFNKGALFSVGDGHAAQGDGEVCVSAIETSMEFACRFKVHKEMTVTSVHAIIPSQNNYADAAGYYLTTGISADMPDAARQAVREMLTWLAQERHIRSDEAYVIASIAGDLKISQAVNLPNWTVSFTVPLSVFH